MEKNLSYDNDRNVGDHRRTELLVAFFLVNYKFALNFKLSEKHVEPI